MGKSQIKDRVKERAQKETDKEMIIQWERMKLAVLKYTRILIHQKLSILVWFSITYLLD